MKLLCYQAKSFSWEGFSQTIPQAEAQSSGSATNAAVIWIHVEEQDVLDRKRIFRHTLKQIKWVANKKSLKNIVLHSFAHLGGTPAPPEFAQELIQELSERLSNNGYQVQTTPFGWFCSWSLDVYGDSMAKVFTHIEAKISL
jgi:hypothetical protein